MLLRLPPDPPEKWLTIRAALQSSGKTRRLCLIMLVSGLAIGLVLAVPAVAVIFAKHWV
jgi:hypothetical protein